MQHSYKRRNIMFEYFTEAADDCLRVPETDEEQWEAVEVDSKAKNANQN